MSRDHPRLSYADICVIRENSSAIYCPHFIVYKSTATLKLRLKSCIIMQDANNNI